MQCYICTVTIFTYFVCQACTSLLKQLFHKIIREIFLKLCSTVSEQKFNSLYVDEVKINFCPSHHLSSLLKYGIIYLSSARTTRSELRTQITIYITREIKGIKQRCKQFSSYSLTYQNLQQLTIVSTTGWYLKESRILRTWLLYVVYSCPFGKVIVH